MKNRKKKILPALYLILILVIMYIPIAVTIIYSFNESKVSSVWGGFSLKWYGILIRDHDLIASLGNSLLLAVLSCAAAVVIGTLGAYGMYKTTNRLNGLISYMARLPLMIPEIIMGMVFLAVFSLMGLPFGMLTLVIAHTSFCIPYILIMVSARLIGMDRSLEEAARDLGASSMQTFFDIILPQILPAILSGTVLSFAMSIDDVVISIFTTGPQVSLLPVKIYTRIKTGVTPEINALAAVMIVITVGIVILTEIMQRRGKEQKQK